MKNNEILDWQEHAEMYHLHASSEMGAALRRRQLDVFDLNRTKNLRILELGCGTAELSNELAKMGNDVTATDSSYKMLEIARKKVGIKSLVTCNSSALPFENGTFDAVIAIHVLHHCKGEKVLDETLAEINRVLKKNGYFFLCDRNYSFFPWAMHKFVIIVRSILVNSGIGKNLKAPEEPDLYRKDYEKIIGSHYYIIRKEFAWCMPSFLLMVSANFCDGIGFNNFASMIRRMGEITYFLEQHITWSSLCLDRCYILKKNRSQELTVDSPF